MLCLPSLPVMYDVGELPDPLLCCAFLPSLLWTSALPVTAKTAELKLRLFLVVDKVKFFFLHSVTEACGFQTPMIV